MQIAQSPGIHFVEIAVRKLSVEHPFGTLAEQPFVVRHPRPVDERDEIDRAGQPHADQPPDHRTRTGRYFLRLAVRTDFSHRSPHKEYIDS